MRRHFRVLGVAKHSRKETAIPNTVSRPGGRQQSLPVPPVRDRVPAPDPAQAADAIARFLALREFRARLYQCLTSRADALFELCDAILCADHAVTSLVQLSLEAEFTRGHGALYDALADGRIDEEALAALLAGVLPPLADGKQGRAWTGGHDIDYGLLEEALAGLPAGQADAVREACARWRRLRFAIDATPYPRPDAECSPGREHVHRDVCRCTAPARRSPAGSTSSWPPSAPAHRVDRPDRRRAHRQGHPDQPDRPPGQEPAAPARTSGQAGGGAPLVICDAGYSAAALTAALARQPAHLLARLPAKSVFYGDPVTWPGRNGRPPRHGIPVTCHNEPAAANPEPDESLLLPDTPHYGTVRVDAWHTCTPSSTATAAGSRTTGTASCPSCAAPCCASSSITCPAAARRTRPCGYGTPARPAVGGPAMARLPGPL